MCDETIQIPAAVVELTDVVLEFDPETAIEPEICCDPALPTIEAACEKEAQESKAPQCVNGDLLIDGAQIATTDSSLAESPVVAIVKDDAPEEPPVTADEPIPIILPDPVPMIEVTTSIPIETTPIETAVTANSEVAAAPQPSKEKKRHVGVNDFKLLAIVGRGNFGKVLQVQRKSDEAILAMKVMDKLHLLEEDVSDWVEREQKVMEYLQTHQHRNVLHLHHVFSTPAKIVYVTDFLCGGDLAFHLNKSKSHRLPVARARFYFAEIALAIDHLHSHKIIYRDLKPENILLNAEGHAVLADFGFADFAKKKMTQFCGSPDYVSPEMINSDQKPYSFEVDWWSLAIVLHELLTGVCPWDDEDVPTQYEMICHDPLLRNDQLNDEAWELLSAMLKKNLSKRACSLAAIKPFAFLSAVDWDAIAKGTATPPFVPPVADALKNFDPKLVTQEPAFDSTISKKTRGGGPKSNKGQKAEPNKGGKKAAAGGGGGGGKTKGKKK